jgi:NADP-dependent 3-hydroxy acid dehydrogenase YdfG
MEPDRWVGWKSGPSFDVQGPPIWKIIPEPGEAGAKRDRDHRRSRRMHSGENGWTSDAWTGSQIKEEGMNSLQDKRILVAGGTGSVGRHLVQAALSMQAIVVVPSRAPEKLSALESSLDPVHRSRFVPLLGDLTSEQDAARIMERAGSLDGAAVSLGGFVEAPMVLEAPRESLEKAVDGYVLSHFAAARTLIPALRERGGGYVMVNGPLAFAPMFPGTGLVSIATAAQSMLARVLAKETADTPVRVNELVIYSSFGWGRDDENLVAGPDIGRYVAYLLSDPGADVRGRTIHLRSPEMIPTEV